MKYDFDIVRSQRKTVALEITRDAKLLVRAPQRMKYDDILAFVQSHTVWIETHLPRALSRAAKTPQNPSALLARAEQIILDRVRHWSGVMNLTPTGVRITAAQTRFGSCSPSNSLCFSQNLAAYPPEAVDYVVVHELAHIRHKNHGREFYALIERYLPDYREREALLKRAPGELWDVYDTNRTITGRIALRGQKLEPGERHLAISVCIFDANGRMLIQRRVDDKPLWPGLWDVSVGGSALAGESAAQAADREVREELGVQLGLADGSVSPVISFTGNTVFEDYFVVRQTIALSDLHLQAEEVADARYATKEEILHLVDAGQFVPYRACVMELLFSLADCPGAYER